MYFKLLLLFLLRLERPEIKPFMKNLLLYILFYYFPFTALWGNDLSYTITHYSSRNGLTQNTVTCMLQDQAGFMWFGTWNGLNRFDGYNFKSYSFCMGNGSILDNNRINWIGEDRNGYLWILGYDFHIYRLDPKKDQMVKMLATDNIYSNMPIAHTYILPNGHVWCQGKFGGAIRFTPKDTKGSEMNAEGLGLYKDKRSGIFFNQIKNDQCGNEWALTDNGVWRYAIGAKHPERFLLGKKLSSFAFCGNKNYFGTNDGELWMNSAGSNSFKKILFPASGSIRTLLTLKGGNILVVFDEGTYMLNSKADSESFYNVIRYPALTGKKIKSAYEDKMGLVWLEMEKTKAACYLNIKTKSFQFIPLSIELGRATSSNPGYHIFEDKYGTLWIQSYGGGFSYYNRESKCLVLFNAEAQQYGYRFSDKLHSCMSDKQGNLWLCSHSKGLEKVTFHSKQFRKYIFDNNNYESLKNQVRTIYEDREGNIWIGLKSGGLLKFNEKLEYKGTLTNNGKITLQGLPLTGVIYCILQDSKGNFWMGTRGDGLIKAERLDDSNFRIIHYLNNPSDHYSISENSIYSLFEDKKKKLWIGTFDGGLNYIDLNEPVTRFYNYRNRLRNYPIDQCAQVRCIQPDANGNLWIGTSTGAVCLDVKDQQLTEPIFKVYKHQLENPFSLCNNAVYWMLPVKKDGFYFFTFGGGICKLGQNNSGGNRKFEKVEDVARVRSPLLITALEDRDENLWMTSENAIYKYNPQTKISEFFSNDYLGLGGALFSEGAACLSKNGTMYFGTSNGLLYFNPSQIHQNHYRPTLAFSDFRVMNEEMHPHDANSILNQDIHYSEKIVLPYSKNQISLSFAALDYTNPDGISYAYKLEPLDKKWVYSGVHHDVTYMGLQEGTYRFWVKSTNADGIWCGNERCLVIRVLPPLYRTWWAYACYLVVFLMLLYVVYRILYIITRLKHRMSVEQEITEVKLRFFTDISHELRTPLSLISVPLENIEKKKDIPADVMKQVLLIKKNTDRMLRLVNQILDLRRIQNNKMSLCVQLLDIVSFSRLILENFEPMAQEHRIDLVFHTEEDKLYCWADRDKLEKILFNLISNAFKYTPDGKAISVSVYEKEATIVWEIHDQGIGIPKEKMGYLFVRFENRLNRIKLNSQSTGIGLNLVKSLVDLHKGKIDVCSVPEEGTLFVVSFLTGRSHFPPETEFLYSDEIDTENIQEGYTSRDVEDIEPETTEEAGIKGSILIVDDNMEMRMVIRDLLSSEYRIFEASNGLDGLSKVEKIQPDLIISDVMMPGMDGIEFTKRLKDNISTSHIQIILLTAKTDMHSRLTSLEIGADDYITKPFNGTYLKARVDNLQMQRRKLRSYILDSLQTNKQQKTDESEGQPPVLNKKDQEFIDRLCRLVEKNLSKSDMTIEELAREMIVSRTIFFNKLKALTGLAPVEFIREKRLVKAAELLTHTDLNISEICWTVGMNSPKYFSRCFKAKYGISPSEYLNMNRETG